MKNYKKFLIIFWIIFVTFLWIFFSINYYEKENWCEIKTKTDFPFLECKKCTIVTSDWYCGEYNNENSVEYSWNWTTFYKPLILLYPEEKQKVKVEFFSKNWFLATFPDYDEKIKGWEVLAEKDGILYDFDSKMETYWLFWEAKNFENNFDLEKWFVVEGKNIKNFLYEKLTEIWLNTKEKSDFIMFWYPKLQDYKYLQITFAWKDYEEIFPLKITPKPDNILRVFMVVKPLKNFKNIKNQEFEKFERKGFSVVEWWWTILEN